MCLYFRVCLYFFNYPRGVPLFPRVPLFPKIRYVESWIGSPLRSVDSPEISKMQQVLRPFYQVKFWDRFRELISPPILKSHSLEMMAMMSGVSPAKLVSTARKQKKVCHTPKIQMVYRNPTTKDTIKPRV